MEHITALTDQQLEFLRSVDSPTLANAIESFEVRDRTDGFIGGSVRCLFPDLPPLVGRALTITVTNHPGAPSDRTGYWRMWERLEAMPDPSVLVMQDVSGRPDRCAYFGEVMTTFASRLGAKGMVTDGGVRDLAEVREMGFSYFASHTVVSHGNYEVLSVGTPVTLAGQLVRTGDVLHGDANGIVLVPDSVLDELPQAVEAVRTRESRLMAFVRGPDFTVRGAQEQRGY